MTLSIIVAIARNNAIGLGNSLLYHLPNDMRHFKETTTGHTIIMGRKTFESFPRRPLPNRRNIVLSHTIPTDTQGAEWATSLSQALDMAKDDGEVFIIGGATLYQQTLPLTQRLYLTLINDIPSEADTFFPDIAPSDWTLLDTEYHTADDRHAVPYTFQTLQRVI